MGTMDGCLTDHASARPTLISWPPALSRTPRTRTSPPNSLTTARTRPPCRSAVVAWPAQMRCRGPLRQLGVGPGAEAPAGHRPGDDRPTGWRRGGSAGAGGSEERTAVAGVVSLPSCGYDGDVALGRVDLHAPRLKRVANVARAGRTCRRRVPRGYGAGDGSGVQPGSGAVGSGQPGRRVAPRSQPASAGR